LEEIEDRNEQLLDLAAQRRREKQVVDVEVEKTLIVIFRLHGSPSDRTEIPGIADGFYGLPASAVESIVPLDRITYVPGTPPWILGVVNVRGEIESVLDLKLVLGLGQAEVSTTTAASMEERRILIAQEGELRSGLLVDRMVDIAEITSAAINPPPAPLEGGKGVYIAGQAEYAGVGDRGCLAVCRYGGVPLNERR
jgi:purine-binding chemotaxis protein CheW